MGKDKKNKWKPVDPEKVKEMQEKIKSGEMKIVCAPQDKLDEVQDIAYDLVDNILDFPGAFITDLSRLSDFSLDDEDEEIFVTMVKAKYGVDVSEVLNENIVDIASYIRNEVSKRGTV